MPGEIGSVGDDSHDRLVQELDEQREHYLQQLRPRFDEMVKDNKLYLGHREDRRKAHEKWRSWSWLGDPARLTDTEVQSWSEILSSVDPPIQAEGRGTEDEWKARGFERYADYFLKANSWTYAQEMILRKVSIQGWKVLRTGWREIKFSPMRRPSKEERILWDEALNEALKTGSVESPPDPESQPEEFAQWLELTQGLVPGFPAPPQIAPSEVVSYRGPWIYRPSEFQMLFDPFTESWQDQEIVFERVIKPRSWGEQQVEAGKFDAKQFQHAARKGSEDNRLSEWERQIADQIGLAFDPQDPRFKNSDEYHMIWRPKDEKAPYLVMLNRSAFVNVSTEHPFWHRQLPYHCIRNTPLDGKAFGLSSYHQLRRTFSDRLTFRDLLLDGLLLSVMPVFLKNRNLGLSELQKFISPGSVFEVNDVNGFKPGWTSMAGFAELMRVGEMQLNDENTQLGTWENVQGQSATVGRVSATESTARLQQALTKHKKKAERIEEEESGIWPQVMYNAYQFYGLADPELQGLRQLMPPGEGAQGAGPQQGAPQGEPSITQEIVGLDERDPLASPEFHSDTFAEEIAMNIRFRGATTRLNKELQAQMLKDFLATLSQIVVASPVPVPIMSPQELRALARRTYEAQAQKGRGEVFTAAGDQAMEDALQAHLINAASAPLAAQAQVLTLQGQIIQMQQQLEALMNPQPQQVDESGQPIPGNGQAPQEAVDDQGVPIQGQ